MHHQINGHEFEQLPGDSDRQGNLVRCSPWGHKELDRTEQLNNNKIILPKLTYGVNTIIISGDFL